MEFNLSAGISSGDLSGIQSAYSQTEDGFCAILSSEIFPKILPELVECLKPPLFFFLEIPTKEDEEKKLRKSESDPFHCDVYYLDNCTMPVAKAILQRYGELLNADGLVRYGFGSHKTNEEIYCVKYQEMFIYGKDSFKKVFCKFNIPFKEKYKSMWDNFSEENPGECSLVELNGETIFDIPENLKSEGMYFAEVRED